MISENVLIFFVFSLVGFVIAITIWKILRHEKIEKKHKIILKMRPKEMRIDHILHKMRRYHLDGHELLKTPGNVYCVINLRQRTATIILANVQSTKLFTQSGVTPEILEWSEEDEG